jgi:polysaccharide biosynthesis transport protein
LNQALDEKQTESLQTDRVLEAAESQVKYMATSSLNKVKELLEEGKIDQADSSLAPLLKVWPLLFQQTTEVEKLRATIVEKRGVGAPATTRSAPDTIELTAELAAAKDSVMAGLLKRREEVERAVKVANATLGSSTAQYRSIMMERQLVNDDIEARLKTLTANMKSGSSEPINPGDPLPEAGRLTLQEANERLTSMKERSSMLRAGVKSLQDRAYALALLNDEMQISQTELEKVRAARSQLEFEGVSSGRTVVISSGDRPMRPDKDRRKPAAAGAGLAGFGLAFAIFALIGSLDRRLRSISDARNSIEGSKRILGILPALPDDMADPSEVSAVAFAVHHIRTLLQLGASGPRNSVFAITSAAPQDGKTSLTTALGMSYATSGAKTLLIDADIVGGGLSHRMGSAVRPRLGSILVRMGLINSEQLEQGLAEAEQSGTRLGRVLVKLGFIKPTEKRQALAEQASGNMGLLDMLDGNSLEACTFKTATPNLSVMAVGNMETSHSGRISVDSIRRIIEEARKQYDVVIFDTGPLLGSLEAGIVAASVDEVIVAVARGQQISLLDQTFARLKDLNAKVAGIVFNRAQYSDIERSGYSSSMISQRMSIPAQATVNGTSTNGHAGGTRQLGPIAGALASSAKAEDDQ